MFQAPRGTRDILPEEEPIWEFVERTAVHCARLYGYRQIRTPTFEDTALFARGVGDGTDIVEKEMYSFTDRGGEQLTLRPEATASVVRAYLQHGFRSLPQPVRLYSFVDVFRFDRPQAGRFRQHHQFNCEAIGEADPLLDAEVLSLLLMLYRQLGLRDLRLQVNSIGCPRCRSDYVAALRQHYQLHLDKLCEDCQRRFQSRPLRLLDCKREQCQAYADSAPRSVDSLCSECSSHFQRFTAYLGRLGLPSTINPRLVRGLDYYTRTVFEVWPADPDSQSALGGGGRYDGLAEQLDGPPTPAVGFATGIERIILNLREYEVEPPTVAGPRVYVAHLGHEARQVALEIAQSLRSQGIACILGSGDRSLKAQLRKADTLGVRWTVILGEEELRASKVALRNMADSQQELVEASSLSARLQN